MRPRHLISTLLICLLILPSITQTAFARPIATVKFTLERLENPESNEHTLIIPYAFSTESFGPTIGIGALAKGYGQEQMLVAGTVYASADEVLGGVAGIWDWRIPKTKRFFLTLFGSGGWYPRNRNYSARNYTAGTTRPGSNDSSADQYIETSGYDNWAELSIEYILPLGAARNDSLQHYQLSSGMLVSEPSGGTTWNPLTSGVSSIILRQSNRYRSFDLEERGEVDDAIHPFTLGIYHNNTDFPSNPSYGSSQFISVSRNFSWEDSSRQWTFWEFETSKYISLGPSKQARQRVIALNFWTGDTPTWQETLGSDGIVHISDAAPPGEGALLGGFYRMRGYSQNRFNDRSVIYSAAEYRHTLRWNPLSGPRWLRFLQSDWIQPAPFVEVGRVAGDYSLAELTSDLKADAGLGIRGMFAGGVARIDCGYSSEGLNIWAMFNQPF